MNLMEYYAPIRISQAEMARRLGISPATFSQYVTGVRPVPVRRAPEIAAILGPEVTLKELLPGTWQLYWPDLP